MESNQNIHNSYGADRWWPFAEGGGPTMLLAVAVMALFGALWWLWPSLLTALLGVVAIFFGLAVFYFFRDPNRPISPQPDVWLSPGDGKVVEIVEEDEAQYLQQRVRRVSIFLDVYNVHVQRIPLSGAVLQIVHRPGRFLQAFRPEASLENEAIEMVVDSAENGPYLVKQIAGILARRCVNKMDIGQHVTSGQRFGLIRFGSRVDLFLPLSADMVVQVGDAVYAGLTPIARA